MSLGNHQPPLNRFYASRVIGRPSSVCRSWVAPASASAQSTRRAWLSRPMTAALWAGVAAPIRQPCQRSAWQVCRGQPSIDAPCSPGWNPPLLQPCLWQAAISRARAVSGFVACAQCKRAAVPPPCLPGGAKRNGCQSTRHCCLRSKCLRSGGFACQPSA
jgi:hypothetical protein